MCKYINNIIVKFYNILNYYLNYDYVLIDNKSNNNLNNKFDNNFIDKFNDKFNNNFDNKFNNKFNNKLDNDNFKEKIINLYTINEEEEYINNNNI